jgi:hypothetical protein
MKILLVLIGLGIVQIGRAVYVAQKIKKDPETKKYGDNPQKAVGIMAITGAVLFAAGCIGLPISDALKPVVYTFVNNSAFPVTVMPEYGDDFQIQPGATKSFESKHKDMKLNYIPAKYVQAQKDKLGVWKFTNGDYYLEENRGFLIYPPEAWQSINYPGLKYKAIIGPVESEFAPNINFVEENNPFNSFFTYADVASNNMREAKAKIIDRGKFTTDSGIDGIRIETNTQKLLQIYYLFDTGQQIFTVTCSAPLQSDVDYAMVFDNSVKTLEFIF